jgi:DNA-binding transcriptional regulator YbjK
MTKAGMEHMEMVSSDYRIKTVLGRLEMIIENENQRIGHDPEFDFKVSNAHKSRCLYELTMLFRSADPKELAANHVEQMHALKAKLKVNARRVEAHLNAVRTVADLLKNAVRDADGDGTYTQEQFLYSEA